MARHIHIYLGRKATADAWNESDHPRADNGQFGSHGGHAGPVKQHSGKRRMPESNGPDKYEVGSEASKEPGKYRGKITHRADGHLAYLSGTHHNSHEEAQAHAMSVIQGLKSGFHY